jgi:hypothetical protein
MPSNAEAVEQLTQHIRDLEPSQVASELTPILSHRGLLTRTVQLSSLEDSDEILSAVWGAIDRVPLDKLAEGAADAVLNALRDEEGKPRTATAGVALRLAAHGERLISLISYPWDRAWKYTYLSEQMAKQIPGRENIKAQIELARSATSLIDSAAETTSKNPDPEKRSYQFRHEAEYAAQNVANARELTDKMSMNDPETQPLYMRLANQHMDLYNLAIASADAIEEPHNRYKQKIDIAVSMAEANALTSHGLFSTNARLLEMVRNQVTEVVQAYDTDSKLVDITLAQRCRELVEFGRNLAEVVNEDYESAEQDLVIQRNLIRMIEIIFGTARADALSIRQPRNPLKSRLEYKDIVHEGGYFAGLAAGSLIDRDLVAAKHIYAVAFDLEQVEDRLDPNRHNRHNSVIQMIYSKAEKQKDVMTGFALLVLADELERSRLPENTASHDLEVNARVALRYLAEARVDEATGIEEIEGGAEFVEWIVRAATRDNHVLRRGNLYELTRHVNDPGLKQLISDGVDRIWKREQDARAPKSETARLAEQITGSR